MTEVYFAHSKLIYGTKEEEKALKHLRKVFGSVVCPHNDMGELGSIYPYLERVSKCCLVVALPYKNFIGKGVFSEIEHALALNKPVLVLKGKELKTVYGVVVNDSKDWKFKYGKLEY